MRIRDVKQLPARFRPANTSPQLSGPYPGRNATRGYLVGESQLTEADISAWLRALQRLESGAEPASDIEIALKMKLDGVDRPRIGDRERYGIDPARWGNIFRLIKNAPDLGDIRQAGRQHATDQLTHELGLKQLIQQHELEQADAQALIKMDATARMALKQQMQTMQLEARERLSQVEINIRNSQEPEAERQFQLQRAREGYNHEMAILKITQEGEYKKALLETNYQIRIKELELIDNREERQQQLDKLNAEKARELAVINAETQSKIQLRQADVDADMQRAAMELQVEYMQAFKPIWTRMLDKASEYGRTLSQQISSVVGALGRLANVSVPRPVEEQNTAPGRRMPQKGDIIQWQTMRDRSPQTGRVLDVKGLSITVLPTGEQDPSRAIPLPLGNKSISYKVIQTPPPPAKPATAPQWSDEFKDIRNAEGESRKEFGDKIKAAGGQLKFISRGPFGPDAYELNGKEVRWQGVKKPAGHFVYVPPSTQTSAPAAGVKEVYNPLDDERREQRAMDREHQQFKRDELEFELRGEEERMRAANAGTFYLRINGRIWSKSGQPVAFPSRERAVRAGQTIKDRDPRREVVVTRNPKNSDTVAESRDTTYEDILTSLQRKLGDYLQDVATAVKKDPDLLDRIPDTAQDVQAVKTIRTDDGHEIKIHGNEDDGFRISIRNRDIKTSFQDLDEAVMACEIYCARRRHKDYLDEKSVTESYSEQEYAQAMQDFLARGGKIEKGVYKEPKLATRLRRQGSRHIGQGSESRAGQLAGRGANIGGTGKPVVSVEETKKDACYNKVKSRYKVWPSAYASGALVQCRKQGAANWGNKGKK